MILWDQRERCGDWAKQYIPYVDSWGEWYQAIGLERDGELQAVVVYNHYTKFDIAIHIAAIEGKRWMTRQFLKAGFSYPFVQLGVQRVTGYVPSRNLLAQHFDEHLGFRREGVLRHALPTEDLIVYGMLRSECRWLDENSHKRDIRLVKLRA